MNESFSEWEVVRALARHAIGRVTRKVILHLQKLTDTLSGDESELKTTWDEICVQVQYQESFYWEAYEETARSIISACVEELEEFEIQAIWLQTERGANWVETENGGYSPPPIIMDEIDNYILRELYGAAADWSNTRIRAYLDRPRD